MVEGFCQTGSGRRVNAVYDVVIIGAGVSGCAIARELSRYQLKVAVLEKASDICEGTSKANSGVAHAGFDAKPGTLMAKLNIMGSQMMEALSKELDFPYRRNGSLVLCFDEKDKGKLEELKARGEANGVTGLEILSGQQVRELEPAAGEQVVAALHAPSGAIICPFGITIALAENAAVNGVQFYLNETVEKIQREADFYILKTGQGEYQAKVVINAAGVYADTIHNMVSKQKMKLTPRRGEYLLCDKKTGDMVSHTLFQLPTALGKGVLVTPTVHGNLLIGPTATDIEDKEGTDTSGEGIAAVQEKAALSVEGLPVRDVITSFAGLRAHGDNGDFVIQEVEDAPNFIDVAGIESPGLTCAPALGSYVADMVVKRLKPERRGDFIAVRKGISSVALASDEERRQMIAENPKYANVVCRCEMVTEGEILDAIHRPLGATTVDGVKRRTRAGMGRCQSGFCNPKVVEILARELSVDASQIRKSGPDSWFLLKEGSL